MSPIQKIIALIIALGLILISIFSFGLYPKAASQPILTQDKPVESTKTAQQEIAGVKVVSTNFSQDNVAVISPNQTLEITFNKPLVRDNTRIIIEPKPNYTTDLSPDHKTLKIIPGKSFDLGKDYTLTIKSGYGTDTGEKLDSDQIFHFKTISYTGV